MLRVVFYLLFAVVLGSAVLIGLGFVGARVAPESPGPGIAIVVSVVTCYTAPFLALGSLVLAVLALAARKGLSGGERILGCVAAACGLLPMLWPLYVFLHQFTERA